MTDHIFVGDRVLLDVSFRAARARLGILAGDGVLLRASEVAYGEGITGMVEAAGPAAGLSRLACPGWPGFTWKISRTHMTAPGSRCDGTPSQLTARCSRP